MRSDIREMSLKRYKREKLTMLEKEFRIRLKNSEREHLDSLETEIAVDNYARTIIMRKL